MPLERLDARTLFDADPNVYVNLRVDADRSGAIDARDNRREDAYSAARGALVLPNVDRDNTTTNAPDDWTGGVFDGRAVAPNNVIDNDADLADVGRVRLDKLETDASYEYAVTVRLVRPANDPAWFAGVAATDRVRLFMPTGHARGGDTVPRAGDVAVIGPGLGDAIRFTPNPLGPGDFDIDEIVGSGTFDFGIEGLRPGAGVRIEVELRYQAIGTDGPPLPAEVVGNDAVALRVAPFVLNDNRQRATRAIIDDLTPFGLDNSALQATMKDVFGKALITSHSGDLWQQDGYEIGYVRAPYGAMPVVLELPRSRDHFFSTDANMRSFVRGTLLAANVGVSLDLAAEDVVDSSSYGGDIESIRRPGVGGPGALLISNLPSRMKDYFAAQAANAPAIELPLDWLAVNHVDEVVQQTPGGKVIVADPDLAWALLTWAARIDPDVRLHAGMNGNEYLPDYTAAGTRASVMLADARLRTQNLDVAQRATSLRGVVDTLKATLGLTEELTSPKRFNVRGTIALARGGAFTRLLGSASREFAVQFDGPAAYRLRYRDAGGAWSKWQAGRTDRDEVFGGARAFLLKNYWTGSAVAGDGFRYRTRPDATLLRMPVLFASSGLLNDPTADVSGALLTPFSEDHVNALVDGTTVVTGKPFGPIVKWQSRAAASDLFQDYATRVFHAGGYERVAFADARIYHDSSGSVHCATNAIRALPDDLWWNA